VTEIGRQYTEGLITQGEKYNKLVDIWAKATDDVANEMMRGMKMAPVVRRDGTHCSIAARSRRAQSHLHDGGIRRQGQ
jgi:DNA-directed RNA polymerase beta' subunit